MQTKLLQLAKKYEDKKLLLPMNQAYRRLASLEYNLTYYEKIIISYHQLQKPQKAHLWTLQWLSILLEKQEWEQAEKISLQALTQASQKIPLYEKQELIYTHWNPSKLNDLWTKLGDAYLQNKQLAEAEKTYQKAYEKFKTFQHATALADILVQQNKNSQGVQMYYQASAQALLGRNLEDLNLCIKNIKQIDPNMEYLDLSQKMIKGEMSFTFRSVKRNHGGKN